MFITFSNDEDFILNPGKSDYETHVLGIAIATHIAILGYGFTFNSLRLMVHL